MTTLYELLGAKTKGKSKNDVSVLNVLIDDILTKQGLELTSNKNYSGFFTNEDLVFDTNDFNVLNDYVLSNPMHNEFFNQQGFDALNKSYSCLKVNAAYVSKHKNNYANIFRLEFSMPYYTNKIDLLKQENDDLKSKLVQTEIKKISIPNVVPIAVKTYNPPVITLIPYQNDVNEVNKTMDLLISILEEDNLQRNIALSNTQYVVDPSLQDLKNDITKIEEGIKELKKRGLIQ